MPLNQLAGVSTPEGRLIVIQPYDASTLKAIEKAIANPPIRTRVTASAHVFITQRKLMTAGMWDTFLTTQFKRPKP